MHKRREQKIITENKGKERCPLCLPITSHQWPFSAEGRQD